MIKLADADRRELKRLLRGYRSLLDAAVELTLIEGRKEPLDQSDACAVRRDRRTISRINFLLEVLG